MITTLILWLQYLYCYMVCIGDAFEGRRVYRWPLLVFSLIPPLAVAAAHLLGSGRLLAIGTWAIEWCPLLPVAIVMAEAVQAWRAPNEMNLPGEN